MLGVSTRAGAFLGELGLRAKPEYIRLRCAATVAPLPVEELVVRVDQVDALGVTFSRAMIVENEITYLTIPIPGDGVVIWGKGFDLAKLGRWPALEDAEIDYWGDLDTYGFAILHQLRTYFPQTRSFLMDADTLHEHRERWGSEVRPTVAALPGLTSAEAAVYDDLVSDRFAERLRLEQERISWDWVLERLPYQPA